ncbi:hypothetical protein PFISCL1PPCAC_21689, partial [Pristionchus fissidentatus]
TASTTVSSSSSTVSSVSSSIPSSPTVTSASAATVIAATSVASSSPSASSVSSPVSVAATSAAAPTAREVSCGRRAVAVQPPSQIGRDRLEMHEVAEGALKAAAQLVLSAARLTEVRHGRQFRVYRLAVEPSVRVEIRDGLVGARLVHELDVHVADHVLANVVAHVHLLDLSVLVVELGEDLVEEVVKVLLLLAVLLAHTIERVRHSRVDDGVPVEVLEQDRLRERRHVVRTGAFAAVSACADLEVERAIDLILLRSINGGEILGSREEILSTGHLNYI